MFNGFLSGRLLFWFRCQDCHAATVELHYQIYRHRGIKLTGKKKGYVFLLILTIVSVLAAASTVIPQSSAYEECMLGYKAHCPFAPISTILCLVAGGVVCVIRKRKFIEE